jgi:8-amino-7-oxononanoate synthase
MSRPDLIERLARAQAERARNSLLRRLRTVGQVEGAHIVVDGKRLLNFASNDYLGLAQHPALTESLVRAAAQWGVGASAAHLLGGHREEHAELERKLARWTGRESALLFSTGYMANLGAMQALLGAGDSGSASAHAVCVQDKLNHASLLDAARLAQAQLVRYPHRDANGARRQAEAHADGALLLATDGVFSMDGDVAPLRELAAIARDQDGSLYVDEAHAIGVLGPEGRGSVAAAGLDANAAPLLLITLGKALGGCGALLVGQDALIEHIAQVARPYIYTTALPPALAEASRVAVRLARNEQWRRERLHELITHFRDGALTRGIALLHSDTPIQPLLVGDNARALQLAQQLEARGLLVVAIRPPTVPDGTARLRITLTAAHTIADVDALLVALAALLLDASSLSTSMMR